MTSLTPLKPVKKISANFWTYDCETEDLRGVNYKIGAIYVPDNETSKQYHLFYKPKDVFTFLTKHSKKISENSKRKKGGYKNIFVHNLTFDIRFLLDYAVTYRPDIIINHIAAGSKDLVVEFKINEYRFRFIDSYQLTLVGQEKLEEILLKKSVKYKIDFSKEKPTTLQLKKRVKSDVLGLYECMKVFFEMKFKRNGIRSNDSQLVSLSKLTLKAFRTKWLKEPVYNPFVRYDHIEREYVVKNEKVMMKIYDSYYGGRTEVVRQGKFTGVVCSDINSLYPSVFDSKPYPLGRFWRKTVRSDWELLRYLNKYEGFVEGQLWEDYSFLPILPTRNEEGRTLFGWGEKEGVFTFPEIKYCFNKDRIRIKYPIELIIFKGGDFFNGFGIDNYNDRKKLQKEGNPLEYPVKIDMNSLYGKLGQKLFQEGIKIINESDLAKIYLGELTPEKIIEEMKNTQFLELNEYVRENRRFGIIRYRKKAVKPFYLPQIASYVTAYARIRLHESMEDSSRDLLYTDTDSIWTVGTPEIEFSDRLGDWKIEKECSEAGFIALKCYAYQEKGKELMVRIKGISKAMVEGGKFKNVDDFLERATEHNFEEYERYNTLRKSLRESKGFLSSSKRKKRITGKYTKRIVKGEITLPVETKWKKK
jgi:hypothetical protein